MDSGEIPIEPGDSWFSSEIALGLASYKSAGGMSTEFPGASKPTKEYQTPNAGQMVYGSQTVRDKLDSQKGKSPDHG